MGAYATDVVEKLWPTNYGGRGTPYLSEGGFNIRDQYGNFSAPPLGYLWDFAKRANVSVRSYGEFASWRRRGGEVRADVPGLEGLVHPAYPPFDLGVPDQHRADIWLEEFHQFERDGKLPRLSIIRLGNDHTNGTTPGSPTPRAMVADNDLALGRIVEAITHSRYWKESAIFVLEDDAQNGPDHVDAHRSVLLAVSPFSRSDAVDSTLYTTCGVLRTMELILGLPPMSQYRCGGDADVRGIPAGVGRRAVHASRRARVTRREERLVVAGRPCVAADEPARGGHGARAGAERDYLAVDSRRRRP